MSSELEARLADLAARRQTVTYGALARELGLRMGPLTQELERLMGNDTRNGRPMRASLCAGRLSGGMPARGFFDTARLLGHEVADETAFVAAQRAALFAAGQNVAA